MRVLLVQPPQCDPAQPYSSLAILTAAWRRAGLDVAVADLNLQLFDYLCCSQNLTKTLETVETRLSAGRFHSEDEHAGLLRAVSASAWLPAAVDQAIATLKGPRFYDPEHYAWALRVIKRALDAISALVFPGHIGLQSFDTAMSYRSSTGILGSIDDRQSNLFIPFCEQVVKPWLIASNPDVIALSTTFQTQLAPTWTLAALAKKWLPGVKIVAGGATITRIKNGLLSSPQLFRDLDACILFEGETAFPALLEEWACGRSGLDAPNVLLPNPRDSDQILRSDKIHTEDLDALPAPDHAGLPIDDYWCPEPALLLNTARGCYYGRCTFCMISPASWGPERMGKAYRFRSVENVVADMRHIQTQTGARAINLANDVLSPRFLRELAEALTKTELDISWDSEIRLERGLTRSVLQQMYAGGCRHLRFGFETASSRVASLMDKGTDLTTTTRILDDCRDVGIIPSLLCQVGFPTERVQEAAETLQYLRRVSDRVAFLSLSEFVLETGSGVYQHPEQFGIEVLPMNPTHDLAWAHAFRYVDGSPHESLYEEMERLLDEYYPERDLFFKGGLGHAHTTLYTRRYPLEDFIRWNRQHIRRDVDLDLDAAIHTAQCVSFYRDESKLNTRGWSSLAGSSLAAPEYTVYFNGSILLLLLACAEQTSVANGIALARALSGNVFSEEEALELVRSLFKCGLLLGSGRDPRVPAAVSELEAGRRLGRSL